MANPEQLAMLKEGVHAWNEWRKKHQWILLNLSGADLGGADLSGADLSDADLSRALLSRVLLSDANLFRVNLSGAYLSDANLFSANLIGAHLPGANLSRADLSGANLSRAHLYHADLRNARLPSANLSGADLSGANLSRANLPDADLSDVTLRGGQLVQCDLTGAMLTGAKLYGTARDDWIIQDVECRYIFWDAEGRIRSPKDRDLAPGEFEQLYRTLPTIEYVFQNGMTPLDPLIMDRVVQAIREQNPEYDIKIDSISARGLAPSIKFTVQQEDYKEPGLQMVVAEYESRLRRIEAEKDRLYNLLGQAIDKAGTRLIEAGPGAVVVTDNGSISIEQNVYYTELRKAIENDETLGQVAKRKALDVIGGAIQDFAKGQVKEAAKQIYELGKDLGPVIVNTVAYGFFKSCLGL